jgi:hypothetical protein
LILVIATSATILQNVALVTGTYGVIALSHAVKGNDKGSVIVYVPKAKAPKTAVDAAMNPLRTGNLVWTKGVLQSAILAHGNHGHRALPPVEMMATELERDRVIQAVIQIVPMKLQKKLLLANQRIAHHAHRHHVTVLCQNAINLTDAKKNVNQKSQNANGLTGLHSAPAVRPVTKELSAEQEIATADQTLMNQKLIYQDLAVKEILSKKNLAITDHVKNANQETGHLGLSAIAKLNHQ